MFDSLTSSLTLENLIIPFITIAIVGLTLAHSKGKLAEVLSSPVIIYSALMTWTITGFIFVWDNSMNWGCIVGAAQTFDIDNILYSGLSALLLTIGFFIPGKRGFTFLIIELIYWIFKLATIKGGYAVGIGGTPDTAVVFFDSIALTLRLLLIQNRYGFKIARKAYLIPIAFIIMMMKVVFFT